MSAFNNRPRMIFPPLYMLGSVEGKPAICFCFRHIHLKRIERTASIDYNDKSESDPRSAVVYFKKAPGTKITLMVSTFVSNGQDHRPMRWCHTAQWKGVQWRSPDRHLQYGLKRRGMI